MRWKSISITSLIIIHYEYMYENEIEIEFPIIEMPL